MANFDESYLSTRAKFFDSVKSSWPPISRATTYVHLKNLTSDPPSPLNGQSTVWTFCSSKMNHKINHIHERALRLVYQDYTTSFEGLLKKDNSLTFHQRNIHQVAIEMFKVKHDLSPPFMKEIFTYLRNEKGTRSGDTFLRPSVDSVYKGDQSLRSFGPIVWNDMLPSRLKSCQSLSEFKTNIKSWIPDNCPCKLCKTYIPGLGYANVVDN